MLAYQFDLARVRRNITIPNASNQIQISKRKTEKGVVMKKLPIIVFVLIPALLLSACGNVIKNNDITSVSDNESTNSTDHSVQSELREPDESEAPDLVGTWKAETGYTTHFYHDGTGITEGNDGTYEFTWEITSLTSALSQHNYLNIRQYMLTVI